MWTLATRPATMFVGSSFGSPLSHRQVALVSPCPNCQGWMIWSGLRMRVEITLTGFSMQILGISACIRAATKASASARSFCLPLNHLAPDTAKCVDIATTAALRRMILPGVIAVAAPVLVGFGLGPASLGGMLGGALIACVLLALMMANAGGAWDNAKKYVEKGNLGGKGSDTHSAAVVGDTVGDPFKDTSGPSMNILINVMAIVSLVIAPLL